MSSRTARHAKRTFLTLSFSVAWLLAAGGPTAADDKLRIQTDFVAAGSHRLGQVADIATRQFLLAPDMKRLVDAMANSGVDMSELRDGSVVVVVLNCCGNDKIYAGSARWLYVPPDISVQLGDIVEYRVGHPPDKKNPGELNTVVTIREKAADFGTHCRWDPPNDRLWMRILYCDWMPAEGWVTKNTLYKTWCVPPKKMP
jgi:hypothetical protein